MTPRLPTITEQLQARRAEKRRRISANLGGYMTTMALDDWRTHLDAIHALAAEIRHQAPPHRP